MIAEHGRGVFVRPRPRLRRLAYDRFARRHREAGKAAYYAEAEAEAVTASVDQIEVYPDKASADVAQRLGLRKGAKVLVRSRRYLSDDQPTEIATSYIPWELAKGTTKSTDTCCRLNAASSVGEAQPVVRCVHVRRRRSPAEKL